ncbi:MAG: Ribosomal RNA small subunit methyltransferase I [Parcubacteria group bacterium GW2011_GWA1_47_11]|nr:MAG: Ribosomal RNA small subunit methyltransferase I [Parcubacteria group bacterium GW2011_GWA1_47_11]
MQSFDSAQDRGKPPHQPGWCGGKLSVVATPIGNLEDITLRALRTLKEASIIYCEDTRVTSKLLSRYEIHTPLRRLDANIEKTRAKEVIDRLVDGAQIAYVTDAGTPGISDPGVLLVAAVRQALGDSFPIEAIPGPSALAAALSVAGVRTDSFLFLGFLPHKKGRQTLLKKIATTDEAVVLYESTHRIMKLLLELDKAAPHRQVVVLRELTKKFENVQIGKPWHVHEYFSKFPVQTKGEFVVIVEGA